MEVFDMSSPAVNNTPRGLIVVYDEQGNPLCSEKECDAKAQPEAYTLIQNAQKVYDFFKTFGMNGIDGKGEIPPIYLGLDEENAVWECGLNPANAGKCDFNFHRIFGWDPKVLTHEWTHAIISKWCPLNDGGEPGALNESLGDVFAVTFGQMILRDRSWKVVGKELLGEVSRDFSKKTSMQEFSSIKGGPGYYNDDNDWGWVHYNSRIPSHAFYQAVKNSGNDLKTISFIWFNAMLTILPNETFADFANRTINVISKVIKAEFRGEISIAVTKAWTDLFVLPKEDEAKRNPPMASGSNRLSRRASLSQSFRRFGLMDSIPNYSKSGYKK
jgi:Zn-dependent metalloprotease